MNNEIFINIHKSFLIKGDYCIVQREPSPCQLTEVFCPDRDEEREVSLMDKIT